MGWCLKTKKNQEKGNGKSSKFAEKHENVKIVPSHNIHINLSPCHCCFVTLQPFFKLHFKKVTQALY